MMEGDQKRREMLKNVVADGPVILITICDVIKQNQSEVGNIDFEI